MRQKSAIFFLRSDLTYSLITIRIAWRPIVAISYTIAVTVAVDMGRRAITIPLIRAVVPDPGVVRHCNTA